MPLPAVLAACIDDACSRGSALIEHACDHAESALEEERRRLESVLDRQDYTAALHELSLQRMAWAARFPEALRESIRNPPRKAGAPVSLRPSSLSLVDDSELMQSIETSRLTQQLASLVEQPLVELDALMSSALGLEGVQPEHNPLRPEIFAAALRNVLGTAPGLSTWPALWMRHMARPLGEDLSRLYAAASKILRQARVEAAAYRVVTAPAPLTPAKSSQPAPLAAARVSQPMPLVSQPLPLQPMPPVPRGNALQRTASGFVERVTQALRGPRFSEFLFRGSAQARQPLDAAYFARVDEELAQLEGAWDEAPPDPQQLRAHEHVPVVERPMREVGTATPLSREVWGNMAAPRQRSLVRTRLKRSAENAVQVMGIEVVKQLVDQVARDPRLLAPVREAIVALEPSLARLALASPRFFGEAEHPARNLVESVAERSFKYNDEFGSTFQEFFAGVTEHFRALNSLDALTDAAPFEFALKELRDGWAEQDREEAAKREQLMEAVRFAERRQQEAGEIAWGLGQRSDLEGVPAAVQDFLFGRWAIVMAHARLRDGGREIDPGGYGAVISDLLWTVKRDTVLRDPARAFVLIPRVVAKLRAGLEMMGDAPHDNDAFFKALERLHRPVLKLRARHRQQAFDIPSELPPDADLQPATTHTPPAQAEELWLAHEELHHFGFEDTMPSDFADLDAKPTDAPAATPARSKPAVVPLTSLQADATIAGLHVGCWVDLFSKNQWRRAQLTWASGNSAFYMFVSHGGRPHSMTKRSLQRLVTSRLVRPIESHEVVQHAIEHISREEPEAMAA